MVLTHGTWVPSLIQRVWRGLAGPGERAERGEAPLQRRAGGPAGRLAERARGVKSNLDILCLTDLSKTKRSSLVFFLFGIVVVFL